jgi:hypothetical protein
VVHRTGDAAKHIKCKHVGASAKKELLETFMRDHKRAYDDARAKHAPVQCLPMLHPNCPQSRREATERQSKLAAARKGHTTVADQIPPMLPGSVAVQTADRDAQS